MRNKIYDKMRFSTKCGEIKGWSSLADLVSILINLQIGEVSMAGIARSGERRYGPLVKR